MSSRAIFVYGYAVMPLVPSQFEPFAAPASAVAFASVWILLWVSANLRLDSKPAPTVDHWRSIKSPPLLLLMACSLPATLSLWRFYQPQLPTSYIEILWFAFWSGWSCCETVNLFGVDRKLTWSRAWQITSACAILLSCYWFWQSRVLHQDFLLGFNDFGHFAQRIANTSNGVGVLIESPVLPRFWDHFNPGLLLLVPLWKLYPSVQLIFALQAIALASSAIAVFLVARALDLTPLACCLWSLAWLAQPVIGQSNLAYTYGWHPISMAITPMLLSFWAVLRRRYLLAAGLSLLAVSFEEGVIVGFACVCFALALVPVWSWCGSYASAFRRKAESELVYGAVTQQRSAGTSRSSYAWLGLFIFFSLLFILVFKVSGLSEFQTGRFHKLGSSVWQIMASPWQRPEEFWGQIFRTQKAAFLLSLMLPIGVFSLLRGWRIAIAATLPLLVLIVWDHGPATSLAFQYTSSILPTLWLATLIGCCQPNRIFDLVSGLTPRQVDAKTPSTHDAWPRRTAESLALLALASGTILSLFVGQLPYSIDSLMDVKSRSYISTEDPSIQQSSDRNSTPWKVRSSSSPAGIWLREQLGPIQQQGSAVLATSRIAAHLVGNKDVETVGQFLERRELLSQLPDRLGQPLSAYSWIVLDRSEAFQQSPEQTGQVERLAREAGFLVRADQYNIVILQAAQ